MGEIMYSYILILFFSLIFTPQLFSVDLQKHQGFCVDYLLKNDDQKGLLINHGLGTGKTYLSRLMQKRKKRKKSLFYCLVFLKSNWQIQR